jgi:membrane-associated protease RseP (regulator of RpoE activity)
VWLTVWLGVNPLPFLTWDVLKEGLAYSIPVLTILSAHEFGHYFACRYYNVDATLPYFIPAPLPLTGTLGAVIRIREPFPSKRALFDIGVAGPIAGFIALLPFLYWGMVTSEVRPKPEGVWLWFGEPLLWKALSRIRFGPIPTGMDVFMPQVGVAAWWGMLATALNLLPFGQLDGGHIAYASLGRRSAIVSIATLAVVVALALRSSSWILFALMLTAMATIFGFRHPRVIDEHEPLSRGRQVVAVIALVIFLSCFTPVPVQFLQ